MKSIRFMSAIFLAASVTVPMMAHAADTTAGQTAAPGQAAAPPQGATQPQSATQPQGATQPQTAQAKPAAPNGQRRSLNPWVDCGIGAMIFTDTKWAAVTSNIIWDYGTTATTSATSSPNTCESTRAQMQAALFINGTYENLAEETAAGGGEHLTALLNIYGCGAGNQPAATREIRSAMGQAVGSPGYATQTHDEKAAALFTIVDETVKSRCTI